MASGHIRLCDLAAALDELHAATPPRWQVRRPNRDERSGSEQYTCVPSDRACGGKAVPHRELQPGQGSGPKGIAAVSLTDAWIVGSHEDDHAADRTLILHWDGVSLTLVTGPNPAYHRLLVDVAAVSPQLALAVGATMEPRDGFRAIGVVCC